MPLKLKKQTRFWVVGLLILLLVYVLVPQLASFHSSWQLLLHPQVGWLLLATGAVLVTYLAAALTYVLLTPGLPYGRTLVAQFGAMFVNRLLPGGVGALGTSYAYLRSQHHASSQATAAVTLNNTLGVLGHLLLILAVAAAAPHHSLNLHGNARQIWGVIALGASLLLLIGVWGGRRLRRGLYAVAQRLATYRHQPLRLIAALGSSMLLTTANILAFGLCCVALGVQLPFFSWLVIFTLGAGAGSAVPTPGGLGGFEAGLTAGLVAAGVASSPALATALLFRFVSYWLPLLPGAVALAVCQRRGWLKL